MTRGAAVVLLLGCSLTACKTPPSSSSSASTDAPMADAQVAHVVADASDARAMDAVDAATTAEVHAAKEAAVRRAEWDLELAEEESLLPGPRGGVWPPGLIKADVTAPVSQVIAAFDGRARAVVVCTRGIAHESPVLRVRTFIGPEGRATEVITDPAAPLTDAARSCVESALTSRPFPLTSPNGITVSYAFAYANR